jgi:hypothetical protein
MLARTSMARPLLLSLVLCVTASAQTFKGINYLYRADDQTKPVLVLGALTFDTASKSVKFGSVARSKKQIREDFPEVDLEIKADALSSALYERASKPRYGWGMLVSWPLLFTKEKKHFLTLQYKENGGGRYAVFQLDKNNFREVLAATEATLGKTVERSEER